MGPPILVQRLVAHRSHQRWYFGLGNTAACEEQGKLSSIGESPTGLAVLRVERKGVDPSTSALRTQRSPN